MNDITESFLMTVSADIEKLLVENREAIDFAYRKIGTGMKVAIGITLDPTASGISVNYDMGFDIEPKPDPPEKHKVKYRHVIDDGTLAMDFLGKEIRDGKMSIEVNGVRVGNVNVE
jgi:hypothetical protein